MLVMVLLTTAKFAGAETLNDYKLGPGDVISVTVFDEPELSLKNARISGNGAISMPLVGQIRVKGLTITEIEENIHNLYLGDYLKKPDISVTISEYRQFYVNGEVRKPGGYSYRDGMNVQRAITLAGGFTERASKDKIFLQNEGKDERMENVELSQAVMPGDVITVEESFF